MVECFQSRNTTRVTLILTHSSVIEYDLVIHGHCRRNLFIKSDALSVVEGLSSAFLLSPA